MAPRWFARPTEPRSSPRSDSLARLAPWLGVALLSLRMLACGSDGSGSSTQSRHVDGEGGSASGGESAAGTGGGAGDAGSAGSPAGQGGEGGTGGCTSQADCPQQPGKCVVEGGDVAVNYEPVCSEGACSSHETKEACTQGSCVTPKDQDKQAWCYHSTIN